MQAPSTRSTHPAFIYLELNFRFSVLCALLSQARFISFELSLWSQFLINELLLFCWWRSSTEIYASALPWNIILLDSMLSTCSGSSCGHEHFEVRRQPTPHPFSSSRRHQERRSSPSAFPSVISHFTFALLAITIAVTCLVENKPDTFMEKYYELSVSTVERMRSLEVCTPYRMKWSPV